MHFLVPCGTTGESPTLTDAERVRIVEILVDEAAGTCPSSRAPAATTRSEVIHAGRRDAARPARQGLLSVTPYYNKPTQEGLYQHYRAIAESTPLPIILYNVPGRTGVNIEPRDARSGWRRSRTSSASRKPRATSRRCARSVAAVPADFIVLSGDDAMTLPLMAIGGRGIISVASNEIPGEMVADGRSGRARRLRGGARHASRASCR